MDLHSALQITKRTACPHDFSKLAFFHKLRQQDFAFIANANAICFSVVLRSPASSRRRNKKMGFHFCRRWHHRL